MSISDKDLAVELRIHAKWRHALSRGARQSLIDAANRLEAAKAPAQKERCIAEDQWAIDAFYEGYDKANADFKANGFSGLKPIIGGIRSLLAAVHARPMVREAVYQPNELMALARENGALKGALDVIANEKSMSLDWAKDIATEALSKTEEQGWRG